MQTYQNKGRFLKHQYVKSEEVFIVVESSMSIEIEKETVKIKSSEMIFFL